MSTRLPGYLVAATCVLPWWIANTAFAASASNVQLLHASSYELGPEERTILTLQNSGGWAYGDNFVFVDVSKPATGSLFAYGEIHPRLSLGKLRGEPIDNLLLKDFSLATELNLGEGGSRTALAGLGMDFKVPGFAYFSVNVYWRDQHRSSGSTWQLSPYWLMNFKIAETRWQFTGFVDWAGAEGRGASNLLAVPQLLMDVGHLFGSANRLYAGLEYSYWQNKFGVRGVDEKVAQVMLKLPF